MKLELNNIRVVYEGTDGEPIEAVHHVNLAVESGQALAIIGSSGCGKSTLLRVAAGLQKVCEGNVSMDGAPLTKPRPQTALILQDFGLLPWKTVYKNAELGLRIRGVDAQQRKRRTMAALEQVGLADMASRYPHELSGGMQQRLALARALALDVDLLLMDEPLSALDALLRESMQDTLLKLWRTNHHAHILVTHSIEEAVYLGQRIVVLTPRPARIAAIIDNPQMGTQGFRTSQAFFERCTEVREALDTAAQMQDADTFDAAAQMQDAPVHGAEASQTQDAALLGVDASQTQDTGGQVQNAAAREVSA